MNNTYPHPQDFYLSDNRLTAEETLAYLDKAPYTTQDKITAVLSSLYGEADPDLAIPVYAHIALKYPEMIDLEYVLKKLKKQSKKIESKSLKLRVQHVLLMCSPETKVQNKAIYIIQKNLAWNTDEALTKKIAQDIQKRFLPNTPFQLWGDDVLSGMEDMREDNEDSLLSLTKDAYISGDIKTCASTSKRLIQAIPFSPSKANTMLMFAETLLSTKSYKKIGFDIIEMVSRSPNEDLLNKAQKLLEQQKGPTVPVSSKKTVLDALHNT